jgi:hypothetical protein
MDLRSTHINNSPLYLRCQIKGALRLESLHTLLYIERQQKTSPCRLTSINCKRKDDSDKLAAATLYNVPQAMLDPCL